MHSINAQQGWAETNILALSSCNHWLISPVPTHGGNICACASTPWLGMLFSKCFHSWAGRVPVCILPPPPLVGTVFRNRQLWRNGRHIYACFYFPHIDWMSKGDRCPIFAYLFPFLGLMLQKYFQSVKAGKVAVSLKDRITWGEKG